MANATNTKVCSACLVESPFDAFNKHAGRRDGLDDKCKTCNSEQGKSWYARKQEESNGLYSKYVAMKGRCYTASHEHYALYGGRGIGICKEWLEDFEVFQTWAASHGYQRGLHIDRIDNDRGYSPDNCRFITPTENEANKRKRVTPLRNNVALTVDQVRQIRTLIAGGVSNRKIGRQFNVTHGTICHIRSGRTWAEVA